MMSVLCSAVALTFYVIISFILLVGEDESEEETERVALRNRSRLPSLLKGRDDYGYDNPKFQTIFHQDIVQGDNAGLHSPFSDIDFQNGPDNHLQNQDPTTPIANKSGRALRNPAGNAQKKKGTNRINKSRKQDEIDQSRPISDKASFQKLQEAKANQRLLKNKANIGRNNSPGAAMAKKPKNPDNVGEASSKGRKKNQQTEETNVLGDNNSRPKQARDTNHQGADNMFGQENGGETGQNERASRTESGRNGNNSGDMQRGTKRKEVPSDLDQEEMRAILAQQKMQDNKIPTTERGKKIAELRRELYILSHRYKNLHGYKAKCKKLEKELEEMRKMNVQNQKIVNSRVITKLVNDELLQQVTRLAKSKLWKNQKFIANEDQERSAAKFVLNLLDLEEMKDPQEAASLIQTYMRPIKKANFERKTYVANEMKKEFERLKKEKQKIPTVEDISKCLTRTVESEEEYKVFMWYWDVLLSKMLGVKEWEDSVKYYTTISAAKSADNTDERMVSVSDEAMVLLLWDNHLERWESNWEFTHDPANAGKKVQRTNGKYSRNDSGQQKWGGWLPEGYIQFNKYFGMVKEARKNKDSLEVEQKCLDMLREKKGIVGKDSGEQGRIKRNQKKAEKMGETLEVGVSIPDKYSDVQPMVDISSDEDEDDAGSDDDED
jgi:hypothetical protein